MKGTNTAPERIVRKLVFAMGYRYRLHRQDLPGKPDLVFPGLRKVIFVHGCFWHGHTCARGARVPKTNVDYWTRKIQRNRLRDESNAARLAEMGWKALSIWECELADDSGAGKKLRRFLQKSSAPRAKQRRSPRTLA